MSEAIIIYGKDTWPYTSDAREAYKNQGREVVYHDVKRDLSKMDEMLNHSGGGRDVPVIVDAGKVTIGFGGSWGV